MKEGEKKEKKFEENTRIFLRRKIINNV